MNQRRTRARSRARGRGVTLGVVAAIGLTVALGTPGSTRPAVAAGRTSTYPTTPVFSARRVPALVQSVAAERSLRPQLDAVVTASPHDTCLDVRVAGRTLYASRADQPGIPASNQKIVTAKLALDLLGPDHRFTTDVAGRLNGDGVVDGDLYLVGGGDPVLRTKAYTKYLGADAGAGTSLEALADAVVAKGVRHVTGSVVGDESRYSSERSVPGWPDRYLDQHQLGPLSALEVDQSFTSFPATYSEDTLGDLRATDDPPAFAATTFADLLQARGVRIDRAPTTGTRPAGTPTITKATSPPLTAIVAQMLNRSDNQIAELLVEEAGVVKGTGGTTAAGLDAFADAFARLGLPAAGVSMHDGSGLGYDNRLTCALLAELLSRAGKGSPVGKGLAVGGRSGTLAKRFGHAVTRDRIFAKTGTLDDVTSLSGFATPTGAPPLVFSYIANGAPVTPALLDVQEDLGRALVSYAHDVPLDGLGPR